MVQHPDIPEPDDLGPKEVYSFFGLTAYLGQVMEKGLLILAVVLNIAQIPKVTRGLVENLFTSFEDKTFGQLINIAVKTAGMSESLYKQLKQALWYRNHLTHHFFYEHSDDFITEAGRKIMIIKLQEMMNYFIEADHNIETYSSSLWKKYGITQSVIDNQLKIFIDKANIKYVAR